MSKKTMLQSRTRIDLPEEEDFQSVRDGTENTNSGIKCELISDDPEEI